MSKGSLGAGGSQVKQYRDAIDVVSWTGMVVGCVGMIYIYMRVCICWSGMRCLTDTVLSVYIQICLTEGRRYIQPQLVSQYYIEHFSHILHLLSKPPLPSPLHPNKSPPPTHLTHLLPRLKHIPLHAAQRLSHTGAKMASE